MSLRETRPRPCSNNEEAITNAESSIIEVVSSGSVKLGEGYIMSGQDKLERYEQTEARNLIRLLERSKPQEELLAPPDFRLKVLSKIEKTPSRLGVFSWLNVALAPGWAPALTAALLVLSLGVNVWLGARTLGPSEVRTVRAPADAYAFQKNIKQAVDLGAFVVAQDTETDGLAYGFAGKSTHQKSFLLGTLYAQTLAYARSGNIPAAAQRWDMIDRELAQAGEPLYSYRRNMQEWLQQNPPALKEFQEVLPLFGPSFALYSERLHDQTLPLFQAGAWMTNMRLAAAGDAEGLRSRHEVAYFLAHLQAPKGVEDRLRHLDDLLAKKQLSERDVKRVDKLLRKMQQLLG